MTVSRKYKDFLDPFFKKRYEEDRSIDDQSESGFLEFLFYQRLCNSRFDSGNPKADEDISILDVETTEEFSNGSTFQQRQGLKKTRESFSWETKIPLVEKQFARKELNDLDLKDLDPYDFDALQPIVSAYRSICERIAYQGKKVEYTQQLLALEFVYRKIPFTDENRELFCKDKKYDVPNSDQLRKEYQKYLKKGNRYYSDLVKEEVPKAKEQRKRLENLKERWRQDGVYTLDDYADAVDWLQSDLDTIKGYLEQYE